MVYPFWLDGWTPLRPYMGGGFCKFFAKFPNSIDFWSSFAFVASLLMAGGLLKVRTAGLQIGASVRRCLGMAREAIESFEKWHLLIALIQFATSAVSNWVCIWELDSMSVSRWHVCKLLQAAGLWRLVAKLKVFIDLQHLPLLLQLRRGLSWISRWIAAQMEG